MKEIRVRGLVIFREGISTLNIRSTLREPFDFIQFFLCYYLLNFIKKKEIENNDKNKNKMKKCLLSTFFIDLGGQGTLPTYP